MSTGTIEGTQGPMTSEEYLEALELAKQKQQSDSADVTRTHTTNLRDTLNKVFQESPGQLEGAILLSLLQTNQEVDRMVGTNVQTMQKDFQQHIRAIALSYQENLLSADKLRATSLRGEMGKKEVILSSEEVRRLLRPIRNSESDPRHPDVLRVLSEALRSEYVMLRTPEDGNNNEAIFRPFIVRPRSVPVEVEHCLTVKGEFINISAQRPYSQETLQSLRKQRREKNPDYQYLCTGGVDFDRDQPSNSYNHDLFEEQFLKKLVKNRGSVFFPKEFLHGNINLPGIEITQKGGTETEWTPLTDRKVQAYILREELLVDGTA